MMLRTLVLTLALATAGLAVAETQTTRTLDVDADGTATDAANGATADLALDLTGDLVVTESASGVDRTAYSVGQNVTLVVELDGVAYEIPVSVGGEGVSLVQTGVSADAWRFSAQGTTVPGADTRDAPPTAQFRGSLVLVGTDDGYAVSGEGVLTLGDGTSATTWHLSYAGSASF